MAPDGSSIYPFDSDEDVPQGTSLFRFDPLNPPVPRVPSKVGPDSIHYRRQRSVAEFWDDWFEGQGKSLDDLFEHRLCVAWRIIRELAVARGVITAARTTLSEATRIHPSPWTDPFHFFARKSQDPIIDSICEERKLPLIPPDVLAVHPDGRVDEGYDVMKDESLADFIRLTEHVATRRLFIPRTKEGRLGCAGLFDPRTARISWPTPQEIMHFEEILIERIFGQMVKVDETGGDEEARSILRTKFDLHAHEIRQVLAMARAHALVATGMDDPETFFILEIARMKALAAKQSAREDYRGAAQTSRDMLRLIQGRDGGNSTEDEDSIVEQEMSRARKKLPKPDEDVVDLDTE